VISAGFFVCPLASQEVFMPEAENSRLPVLPQVQFFSVNEASLVLGVVVEQIYYWIHNDLLKAFQLGSQGELFRIRRIDLEAFIQQHGHLVEAARKSPGENT
jgi:excisionase family DNA binding protein